MTRIRTIVTLTPSVPRATVCTVSPAGTASKLSFSQANVLLYPSTVRPVYPVITGVYGKNGGSLGGEMPGQSLAHLTSLRARCHGAGHSGAGRSWYADPASS